jgi:hypothetical protein
MGSDPKKIDKLRKAPETHDGRWKELLRLMSVPNHAGIYILGCFAQHVTFYSQQIRALNLIDALCKTGALAEGDSVGVVGAGLAGLTAAAAALRRGLFVYLFQEDGDPHNDPGRMPLQMNSDERSVDPFIYDWPLSSNTADEEHSAGAGGDTASKTDAGLPLLNWTADKASEVRKRILTEFKTVVADERQKRGPDCIRFYRSKVTEDQIKSGDEGRWLVEIDATSPPVAVEVLVLAVGFGVEDSPTKARYWTNDGLGGKQADNKRYLISGAGDGGLTDVMRLCIADFTHRTVLEKFKNAKGIGGILESAVRERRDDLSEYFIREAGNVGVSLEDEENLLASRENKVYVTGSPERLFGADSKASILNRLIVAWLFRRGRFNLVDARLRTPLGPEGAMRSVEFTRWDSDDLDPRPEVWAFRDGGTARTGDAPPSEYHEVIVRHGPGQVRTGSHKVSPLEECFRTFWDESRDNLSYWKRMPHWDDWTRRPIWEPGDFTDPLPLLDPPAGKRLRYLVVEHPSTKGLVQTTLEDVISRLHEGEDLASMLPVPTLNLAEEFQTPHRFGRAVRALCRAEIVVFDLTEKECPEAFILLGIRAVARRGITIVTTRFTNSEHEPEKSDAPFEVPELPFLLQDINFCGWGRDDKFITRLKKGIEQGRSRKERLGLIYRDLPAYEEVRQLGPEPEDYRVEGPERVVLFLSPLNEAYRVNKGAWLKARVGAEETGMYIVESASPERTSLKLYSAIRRTQLCIVDWTERRPNVFFELGVRLAVSAKPPICVIHKDEEWAMKSRGGDCVGGIFDLLRPLVYDREASSHEVQSFVREVQDRKKALSHRDSDAEWPLNDAALSPSFVYEEVRAAIPIEAEDWSVPVWMELRTKATLILGSMPEQYPDLPILFGDDAEFKRRAGRSGLDRLLAAWYFLERRHDVRRQLEGGALLETDKEPLKSWHEIGLFLVRELRHEKDESYARMRDEIDALLKIIETQELTAGVRDEGAN